MTLFLDNIKNNQFLKTLFPDGIKQLSLGNLELLQDSVKIAIHANLKPHKGTTKWGEWGKDYNVVVIHLSVQFLHSCQVKDWQKNLEYEICEFDFRINNDLKEMKFFGQDWKAIVVRKSLIFQKYSSYFRG